MEEAFTFELKRLMLFVYVVKSGTTKIRSSTVLNFHII